jgi:ABC-type phosphate transport system auxiliary subunit
VSGHKPWAEAMGVADTTPEQRARIDAEKVEVLNEHLRRLTADMEQLALDYGNACADRDHWQANHDEVVAKKRRLEERYERLYRRFETREHVGWFAGGRFIRHQEGDDDRARVGWQRVYVSEPA